MSGTPPARPHALEAELREQLEALVRARVVSPLPFLVTLAPGADARAVVPFEPTLEVPVTRLACGTMTPRQALELATHPQVERVEFDGEAHALKQLLP